MYFFSYKAKKNSREMEYSIFKQAVIQSILDGVAQTDMLGILYKEWKEGCTKTKIGQRRDACQALKQKWRRREEEPGFLF